MPRTGRIGSALALGAAVFAVAGCGSGGGGTIPTQDAETLLQRLDEVQASVEGGDCGAAQTNISQLNGAVYALPKEVGTKTKDQLRELVSNLQRLVEDPDQCQEPVDGASGVQDFTPTEPTVPEAAPVTPAEPDPAVPPQQPAGEGTGLPGAGNSGNGPAGPGGNPNQGGGSSGGVGG